MKPWKYNDGKSSSLSKEKEVSAENYIKNLSKEFKVDNLMSNSKSSFDLEERSEPDFRGKFRLPSPNTARMDAAKSMGYRDGLDQYRNPKSYDHRPVSKSN